MFKDIDFKRALQELSEKEKDKLILRLLRRDMDLAEKLYFELVDTDSIEDKRKIMEINISKQIQRFSENFHSLDYIAIEMRNISGKISHHVKITKDKFGEISLNLQMLNEVIEQNAFSLTHSKPQKSTKFYNYVIVRTFKILLLIQALHEDFLLDFKEDLNRLGVNISREKMLLKTANYNSLDINWILEAEIPENILQIHKEIKAAGFLK
ncbi:hypothetical protein [Flavobacterium sp.]|jgi:hypothetical protein|uniref:hypothetical protein n=1 Tax=Flavobacterium sp. TaxID=239 RepID=UPI0037C0A2A1